MNCRKFPGCFNKPRCQDLLYPCRRPGHVQFSPKGDEACPGTLSVQKRKSCLVTCRVLYLCVQCCSHTRLPHDKVNGLTFELLRGQVIDWLLPHQPLGSPAFKACRNFGL